MSLGTAHTRYASNLARRHVRQVCAVIPPNKIDWVGYSWELLKDQTERVIPSSALCDQAADWAATHVAQRDQAADWAATHVAQRDQAADWAATHVAQRDQESPASKSSVGFWLLCRRFLSPLR